MKIKMAAAIFIMICIGLEARGQSVPPATCTVRPLYVAADVRSGTLASLGLFHTDGKERRTIRSFKHEETGLIVTAEIDFVYDYSKSPEKLFKISAALVVSKKEESKIFETTFCSEASTRYSKNWTLEVRKNVPLGDKVGVYILNCWDDPNAKLLKAKHKLW
jgi:hypothetical protein